MKHIHLIGCGGIGAWQAQSLAKMYGDVSQYRIHLWDGDILEARNLDRQLFTRAQLRRNKAAAMKELLDRGRNDQASNTVVHPSYFTAAALREFNELNTVSKEDTILLACVDNSTARLACLLAVDFGLAAMTVIAANEYDTAEAYAYLPQWRETDRDPRVYYAEAYSRPDEHDPLRPSCTGVAQKAAPQLALANMMAAAYQAWLLRLWTVELVAKSAAAAASCPFKVYNTWGRLVAQSFPESQEASNGS